MAGEDVVVLGAGRVGRAIAWDLSAPESFFPARTTGFTATAILRAMAKGLWREAGVLPPELLGQSRPLVALVLAALRERGVILQGEDL